jgi:DNA-binding transcriptional regulator YdaS (Cro superfamily)
MNDVEIIKLLGGVTQVARLLSIKPPSVHGWIERGIPDGRLVELGAEIERLSGGKFSRRARWPDKYIFYWPELATSATSTRRTTAKQKPAAVRATPDAMRTGTTRRNGTRRDEVGADAIGRRESAPFPPVATQAV